MDKIIPANWFGGAPAGSERLGWMVAIIETASGPEIGIDEVYDQPGVFVATEEGAFALAQILAAMLGLPIYDGRPPYEPRGGDRTW